MKSVLLALKSLDLTQARSRVCLRREELRKKPKKAILDVAFSGVAVRRELAYSGRAYLHRSRGLDSQAAQYGSYFWLSDPRWRCYAFHRSDQALELMLFHLFSRVIIKLL